MADSGRRITGVVPTTSTVVDAPATAVDAPSSATPRGVGPAEPPSVSLRGRGWGFPVRGSDRGASMAWRAPTSSRPGHQRPHRAFPPRTCELCFGPRVFSTRNSYNTHLKNAHNGIAYHSAESDRLVFHDRRPEEQAQPQGVRLVDGVFHPGPCLPLVRFGRPLPRLPCHLLCGKLRLGCKSRLPLNRDRWRQLSRLASDLRCTPSCHPVGRAVGCWIFQ